MWTEQACMYIRGFLPDIVHRVSPGYVSFSAERNNHTPAFSSTLKQRFLRNFSTCITAQLQVHQCLWSTSLVSCELLLWFSLEASISGVSEEVSLKRMEAGTAVKWPTDCIYHIPGSIVVFSSYEWVYTRVVRWR